jgi:hypothetical protein
LVIASPGRNDSVVANKVVANNRNDSVVANKVVANKMNALTTVFLMEHGLGGLYGFR